MFNSLQVRINLISIISSALIACALVIAGAHAISSHVTENMLTHSRIAALELAGQMEKLMALGLEPRDIIGFDEQCRSVIEKDEKLYFAGVYDASGKLIFKSGDVPADWPTDALDRSESDTIENNLYLVGSSVAKNKTGTSAAMIMVLVRKGAVSEVTTGFVRTFSLIALVFIVIALLTHFFFLRQGVISPLRELVEKVNRIQPENIDARVDIGRGGTREIGSLANAFTSLLRRLSEAQNALLASNEKLERMVAERTRQLAEANLALMTDIDRRQRLEEELRILANTDPLTGIANRAFMMPYLESRVATAKNSLSKFAVLTFDFDGFKKINDTHGHAAGDAALRVMAQRIQSRCRQTDVLARLGGDEFMIVLEGVATADGARAFANKVEREFSPPVEIGGVSVSLGVSIGIAIFPDHGDSVAALLAAADKAMYCIKQEGGGCRLAA